MNTGKIINIKKIDELSVNGPKVYYYTAKWCGPCQKIAPEIEELAKKYKDIKFFKIDIDTFEEYITDVSSVPTFKFYNVLGVEKEKVIGANISDIKNSIKLIV